jgi:hypothetical protein
MDGFKKNPKIACYKEGGQVGYKSRKTAECDKADVKQDKAIVKKAVGQHEAMKHKGEGKTELKLKTGGRCKKDGGTVRKYKTGGTVSDLDLKNRKAVDMPGGSDGMAKIPGMGKVKPAEMPRGGSGMANIPGMGKVKPAEMPTTSKYKKGGEVIGMKKTAADKKDIAGIKKKGSAPKKIAPKTKQAPAKPMGMAEPEFPMEAELPMFDSGGAVPVGHGAMSDIDRKLLESERQRKLARMKNARGAGLNPGQMAQFAGQEMAAPMQAGVGQAASSNGMGQAAPMGPAGDTDSIMEGLRQLGKYAQGGCV